MPSYTFSQGDLHLTQERIDQLAAACSNFTEFDPVVAAIEEAVSTVNGMTASYTLEEPRWRKLVRSVARYGLFSAAGQVSESEQAAYDGAMKELTGIRDGKEPTLPPASPAPAASINSGNWGGSTKISLR